MKYSAPIVQRSLEREKEKMLPGVIISFTTLSHPPERFGKGERSIGLIELSNGKRVLAPLLTDTPKIGESVRPRMRLSFVTEEKLRVYAVAFEPSVAVRPKEKFPGYILALTGPSGVGKSTISTMLTKACSQYSERAPIITTRTAKKGDDGEYTYVSYEEFERMEKAGEIAAVTRIPSSGEERTYGYRSADIEAIWKKGKIPVVVTEMHLLQGLSAHFGRRSILSFGLLPPGRSKRAKLSQLLHRLRTRGRESEEHIKDRLKNAERDLEFFNERKDLFDHMVVNEDLATLVSILRTKVLVLVRA